MSAENPDPPLAARLTPREQQVMAYIAAGQPNKVVAIDLGISMRTVEKHRARIFSKLGVRNAVELVHCCYRVPARASSACMMAPQARYAVPAAEPYCRCCGRALSAPVARIARHDDDPAAPGT